MNAGARNQREDDPEQQHLLLIGAGHPETGHNDEEDEEIIDREGLLRDVTGEVLRAHGGTAENQHTNAEQQGDADVDR